MKQLRVDEILRYPDGSLWRVMRVSPSSAGVHCIKGAGAPVTREVEFRDGRQTTFHSTSGRNKAGDDDNISAYAMLPRITEEQASMKDKPELNTAAVEEKLAEARDAESIALDKTFPRVDQEGEGTPSQAIAEPEPPKKRTRKPKAEPGAVSMADVKKAAKRATKEKTKRISDEDAAELRRLRAEDPKKNSLAALGARYGLTHQQAWHVCNPPKLKP